MKQIILYISMIFIIGISVLSVACTTATTTTNTGDGGMTGGNSRFIYLDNWGTDINTSALYFNSTNMGPVAPHLFSTADIDGGKTNTNGKFLRMDFSMLTTDGWNGVNAQFSSNQDLSDYNALTFWAKAGAADSKLEKIIVTNGKEANKLLSLKSSGKATLDKDALNTFGTEWRKVVIPVFDSSYLSETGFAVQFIHGFGAGAGSVIDVDELQYEKLADIAGLVDRIAYADAAIGIEKTATAPATASLPGTVEVYLNDLGTGDALIEDTTGSMVTWVSDNTDFVTVEGSEITAVAEGTANVQATLKGTAIKGPMIVVTVTAVSSVIDMVQDRQYLYGSEAGITKNFEDLPSTSTTKGWDYFGGYENSIDAIDESTESGADGTTEYRRLTATGNQFWAAGGWQGAQADLSSYSGLKMYVKNPAVLTTGKKAVTKLTVTFESGASPVSMSDVTVPDAWVPIDFAFAAAPPADYTQIDVIKYELGMYTEGVGNTEEVLIDEVYLYTGTDTDASTRRYIYSDKAGVTADVTEAPFSSVVTTQWQHYEGYEGTLTVDPQASGGADGGAFLRLTGTAAQSWAAGGWGDTPIIDFSAYDALVFSAKSDAATSIEFGLVEEGDRGVNVIKTITAEWQTFTIPFTEFTHNDMEIDSSRAKTIRYVLSSNTDIVDIDEIYLRKSQ